MIKQFEHYFKKSNQKLTMETIDALYCDFDDFNQKFCPEWERQQLESGKINVKRKVL